MSTDFIPLKRKYLPQVKNVQSGLRLPVIYNGQIRVLVDIHYGLANQVYLRDNEGEPVQLSELKIKPEWKELYLLKKKNEESDHYNPILHTKILREKSKLKWYE